MSIQHAEISAEYVTTLGRTPASSIDFKREIPRFHIPHDANTDMTLLYVFTPGFTPDDSIDERKDRD